MAIESPTSATPARAESPALGKTAAPRGRWLLRSIGLLALAAGVAAVWLASSGALRARSDRPNLTHTIARDDLIVTVTEQGMLESSENTEIKCGVRGNNTVIWVIESGAMVEKGDELLRLDTLFIQEQIDERTKYAHWSRSSAERSQADVVRAGLAVKEYEEGRFVSELMELEKNLIVAEANLRSAKNLLAHVQRLANSEYTSKLEVEEKEFALAQAQLDVDVKKTQIDVLKRFTKAEQLQTLKGQLKSTQARHEANAERATADASRRDRALDEIKLCVVRAPRAGLVIHPNAAKWELRPIAEGSNVHKDQILLLMPNLKKMQVKVGVHESVVKRLKEGQTANVTLPNQTLKGVVSSVASVTRPAGWWTGNEVRYDTMVALPPEKGLRPGMSAEVEVVIATHRDVLTIPVAAIVEIEDESYCWVVTPEGTKQRKIVLGDTNDVFTIVKEGLEEGDEVALNPHAFVKIPTKEGAEAEEAELKSKIQPSD